MAEEKQYRASDGYVLAPGSRIVLDLGRQVTAAAVADALNEAYARGRVSLAEELSSRVLEVIGSGGRE